MDEFVRTGMKEQAAERAAAYRRAARRLVLAGTPVQIEDDTLVDEDTLSDGGREVTGAWVQCWAWVPEGETRE
jgi:hypothetical protein